MFPLSLYCLPLCKANSTSFDATGGMQWTYAMHLATSPAASCKPQPSDRSGSHVINPLVRNTRLFINYGGEIVAKVIYSANDKVIDRSTTAITQCWNYTWGFFYSFTPGSKPTFSTNPFHRRFLLSTGLPHDNGTGPDLSRSSFCFEFHILIFFVYFVW